MNHANKNQPLEKKTHKWITRKRPTSFVIPCSQKAPVVPSGQWHAYPSGSGTQVAPFPQRCGGLCSGSQTETVSVQNAPFHPVGQSQLQCIKEGKQCNIITWTNQCFSSIWSQHFQTLMPKVRHLNRRFSVALSSQVSQWIVFLGSLILNY